MVDPPESVVEAGFGSASGGIMLQSEISARNVKSSTATHPLFISPLIAVSMIYLNSKNIVSVSLYSITGSIIPCNLLLVE